MEMSREKFVQGIKEAKETMTYESIKNKFFDRLKNFEIHWDEMCKKYENMKMSRHDAKHCERKFRDRIYDFRMTTIPDSIKYKVQDDIEQRLNQVKDKVSVAILKARNNFRENEKIRLKDAYGLLGELLYIILRFINKV